MSTLRSIRPVILVVILFFLVLGLTWLISRDPAPKEGDSKAAYRVYEKELLAGRKPHFSENAASCWACHKEAFNLWASSQHAWACRQLDPFIDDKAFIPGKKVRHGSFESEFRKRKGQYEIVTVGSDGSKQAFVPEAVLAIDPLRQYLIPHPNGRLQATEMAYDPRSNEWFNVYGEEDRQPHEWGFWANRGMTWNTQCAYCHTTNLKKGYDAETDTYQTTWDTLGVSCRQCHGPMEGHEAAFREPPYPVVQPPTPEQSMHVCATCHTRREELTDRFQPGDSFYDHYRPTLVDAPGIYYADGQVLGENFEFGSFIMSRMGNKKVTCLDCHQPHSGDLILPVDNNALCMSCHNPPGRLEATHIDPVAHSFHKPDSTGNLCVECHMPVTYYMVRDPRRDHGFTIPDPVLTRDHGIPNACNRCHTDKSVEWSIEWTEKWYGEKMERRSRKRAQAVARMKEGDRSVVPELLRLAKEEELPAWRAAMLSLLANDMDREEVRRFAVEALEHDHPLVRSAGVRALRPLPGVATILRPLLDDPVRMVRLDAAWGLQGELPRDSERYTELMAYLDQVSDQPQGLMLQVELALGEQRLEDAERWARRAISWDPATGYFQYILGSVLNLMGRNPEAVEAMTKAEELDPENPGHAYSLALIYGEMGLADDTIKALKRALKADPAFDRAWYNLGLAYAQKNELNKAVDAILKAEAVAPRAADYPYARATIHFRQGEMDRAVEANRKALSLNPSYSPALQFRESLEALPAKPE